MRELRERTESPNRKALSQRELASEIGVAHSRISKLEAEEDETEPSLSDLLAYRSYFNVSIDYLLGLESEPSTDVDLKAISNEYGISSKSMENIRRIIDKDCSLRCYNDVLDDYTLAMRYVVNAFLESISLEDFFIDFVDYLNFYAMSDESVYIWSTYQQEIENYNDITIKDFYTDFLSDADCDSSKMVLNPDIFDDVLLNKVKNSIKDIKRNSALYNELNYLEWVRISGNIEKIKEDIKSNSNLSEKDKENMINALLNDSIHKNRLNKLQKELERYKNINNDRH